MSILQPYVEPNLGMIGKYIIEKQLGEGGFANVFLGKHIRTNQHVAIKVISRKRALDLNMLSYIENELRLISRFDHPNIIKVYDMIYTQENINIIMEYCPNGDLQGMLNSGNFAFQGDQIRIAWEILEALNYLHKRGISHRDIKPANIMFDSDMHVKLIDFGLSKEYSNNSSTICGTEPLIAPEILMDGQYDGTKADIWSFGVTLNLMISHCLPFNYTNNAIFLKDLKRHTLKLNIVTGGVLGWVLKNSLIIDPHERLTAQDLIDHIKAFMQKSNAQFRRNALVRKVNTSTALMQLKSPKDTPVILKVRMNETNLGLKNPLVRSRARFF